MIPASHGFSSTRVEDETRSPGVRLLRVEVAVTLLQHPVERRTAAASRIRRSGSTWSNPNAPICAWQMRYVLVAPATVRLAGELRIGLAGRPNRIRSHAASAVRRRRTQRCTDRRSCTADEEDLPACSEEQLTQIRRTGRTVVAAAQAHPIVDLDVRVDLVGESVLRVRVVGLTATEARVRPS